MTPATHPTEIDHGTEARRGAPLARAAYVHVPFCARRCGYCNFTLVAGRDDLVGDYLRAIERELSWLPEVHEADSLYFGGGTPSQLTEEALDRLFAAVQAKVVPAAGCEITVEVNPADLSAAKVARLAALGVNRLSLGAQSFDDAKLATLQRDHRADDVYRAVESARDAGIGSIALDLIFAAPAETLAGWQRDLDSALRLDVPHLSTYGLTYEKGTTFYGRLMRGQMQVVDEEIERAMYLAAIDRLSRAGCEHYEVSNFARPGKRSRHNEVYWTGRPYLAFGPGAARFVGGRRETNHRSVTTYLKRVLAGRSPVAESEVLDAEAAARERLVFGLRRTEGVNLDGFARETGFSAAQLAGAAIDRFERLGLLAVSDGRLRLTREGLLLSDSLWPEMLVSENGK